MFYPKKKIKDLDVNEVVEFLADESRGGFFPHGQVATEPQDVTNYGQGRIIENEPTSGFTTPTQTRIDPTVQQNPLEAEYQKRQGLIANGAPKERSLAKRLLQGALRGMSTGNIGGAVLGAAVEGFYPKANTTLRTRQQLAESDQNIGRLQQQEAFNSQLASQDAARKNLERDDVRREEEFRQTQTWRDRETARKESDRISRERTSRMNAVAGILKNIPSYDPADERFAELTQALGDVNLPITPKDAKKNVRLVQDQRDGAWTLVLTDTVSGKQEVRPVMTKGNKQLATTPTVVMQGEYGLIKQNDQQEWQGQQNDLNRQQARQIANERIAIANQQIELAKQRLAAAQEKDKAQAQKDLDNAKLQKTRLRAYILSNPLISSDASLLEGLDDQ